MPRPSFDRMYSSPSGMVCNRTKELTQLAQLHERHELTIPVGSILSLADAIAAHELLAATRPHKRGKIVIELNRR